MIHHLTGGAWGAVDPPPARGGDAHAAAAGAAVPAARARPRAISTSGRDPRHVAHDPLLQHKSLYLNVPFFLGARRLLLRGLDRLSRYFLNRWSLRAGRERRRRGSRAGSSCCQPRRPRCSTRSPSPSRRSTGACRSTRTGSRRSTACMFMVGQALSALRVRHRRCAALLAAAAAALAASSRRTSSTTSASCMLAFVMLWAYFALLAVPDHLVGQPARGDPLVPRAHCTGGWQWVALALVVFHFALPFLCCSRATSSATRAPLAVVARRSCVARFVDLFWLVAARRCTPDGLRASHWLDLGGAARRSAGSGCGCSSRQLEDAAAAAARRARAAEGGVTAMAAQSSVRRATADGRCRPRGARRPSRRRSRCRRRPRRRLVRRRLRRDAGALRRLRCARVEQTAPREPARRPRTARRRRPRRGSSTSPIEDLTALRAPRGRGAARRLRLGRRDAGVVRIPIERAMRAPRRARAAGARRDRSPPTSEPADGAPSGGRRRPIAAALPRWPARRRRSCAAGRREAATAPPTAAPAALREVGFDQRLGEPLPLDVAVPRRGRPRRSRSATTSASKPVVLVARLLRLPDALHARAERPRERAAARCSFDAGNEFDVVTVSFDPRETPASWPPRRRRPTSRDYGRPGAAAGWHFLTGDAAAIAAR